MASREAAGFVLAALLAGAAVHAEEPVDDEFLEFLGSLDSDDEAWNDFLSTADDASVDPDPEDAPSKPAEKVKSPAEKVKRDDGK